MKTKRTSHLVAVTALITSAAWLPAAFAQVPATQSSTTSTLLPPMNDQSGTIDEVLSADDNGYHMRGYLLKWHGARVFVAGVPADPKPVGSSLEFSVYRSSVHGQRGLRFAVPQASDDDSVAQDERKNAQVSITSGTAKVEEVLAADSEGYSFVAYLVHWHDTKVAVLDPLLHTPRAVGDQIDFRVFHTGAADNRLLSFSIGE